MKRSNRGIELACLLVLGLSASHAAAQGSLTPPGAPAETMKTLEQVEPRIDLATVAGNGNYHHEISQPGSYYLSANLEVTLPSGIMINTNDVSLDLNGFTISRLSGSGVFGIYISGRADRATVRNGTITGFSTGIMSHSSPSYARGCLFEKLAVSGCTSYGILAGLSSRLVDCRAHDNPGNGIYAIEGSSLSGCIALINHGEYGIYAGFGSSLSGCTAYYNYGTYGIYANSGSSLSGCVADYNQCAYGIFVGNGASLHGCTAQYNTGSGANCYGIYAAEGATVVECTAIFNSHTISPGTYFAQGIGIHVGLGSTVKGCTVKNNEGDGIYLWGHCLAEGNNCSLNGNSGDGAGIHTEGAGNRIVGNHVVGNDRGIDVDAGFNFIARNTASGNGTNYDISGTQTIGPIVTTTGTITNGNPWTNFEF